MGLGTDADVHGPGYYVYEYVDSPNGTRYVVLNRANSVVELASTSASTALATACTLAAADGGTVVEVGSGTYALNTQTIPATVTLRITAGTLSVNSDQTLTVAGTLDATPRQIFSGSGSVVLSGVRASVLWFGAVADRQTATTGAMTAASAALTVTGATFTSADVGKLILVAGAGANVAYAGDVPALTDVKAPLIGTISAVTSTTVCTLSVAATTTVSGAAVRWGTDNKAAFLRASTATPSGGTTWFPNLGGGYMLGTRFDPVQGRDLASNGALIDSGALNNRAFYIANRQDMRIEGFKFQGSPSQHATRSTPPRAIMGDSSCVRVTITNCEFRDYYGGGVLVAGTDWAVTDNLFSNVHYADGSNTYRGAVHVEGDRHVIANNRMAGCYTKGVSLQSATGCAVSSNVIRGDATYYAMNGIVLNGSSSGPARLNAIVGNTIENVIDEGIGLASTGATDPGGRVEHNVVANNVLREVSWHAISLNAPAETANARIVDHNVVTGNSIYLTAPIAGATGKGGIILNGASHNLIEGNSLFSDGVDGRNAIVVNGDPTYQCTYNTIRGNVIQGWTVAGINLTTVGSDPTGFVIEGNVIRSCDTSILVAGTSHRISGNHSHNSTTASVTVDSAATAIDLHDNTLDRAPTLSAGTVVRGNRGYVTEARGTGSIASGATSAVITHGLGTTPAAANISVTFTENPSNDPGNVWLHTITSTQFTVACRADPGVSNLDFSWQAVLV